MIVAFHAVCPVCGADLGTRERASFAYVELERHLEAQHRTNAVRLVNLGGETASPAWSTRDLRERGKR